MGQTMATPRERHGHGQSNQPASAIPQAPAESSCRYRRQRYRSSPALGLRIGSGRHGLNGQTLFCQQLLGEIKRVKIGGDQLIGQEVGR